MDLTAQIIETLAVWTLTHHQPRLYTTSTWLGALNTAGREVVFYRWVWRKNLNGKKKKLHLILCHNIHSEESVYQSNYLNTNEHPRVFLSEHMQAVS